MERTNYSWWINRVNHSFLLYDILKLDHFRDRGLNIMEFCKAFNAQTQGVEPGLPLPVVITAFADKSFTFIIKTPPATTLIKKAVKLDKGSSKPHTDKVGKITRTQLEEIAKTKMKDMTAADLDAAVRTIAGSARSMGVTVEGV